MDRYNSWPFAKGSENNLLTATAVFLLTAVYNLIKPHKIGRWLLAIVTFIWLIVVYFFRDPERDTLNEERLVVCPADGEVVEIATEYEGNYLHQEAVRVSIFLSLFDVHVQRIPINGRVTLVKHVPGQFLQAFRPEASDVNEYIATLIETPYGTVLTKQIAGILARRCVNYLVIGDEVTSGERLGMIRFSSRVDLFLPADAQLLIAIGDKVNGGITPIAQLKTL
jgi:phosphatidylserine decarboxylase